MRFHCTTVVTNTVSYPDPWRVEGSLGITLSSSSLSLFILQRYLALDDRVAWAYFEFPEDLFNGETVEEWVALNGKLGEGQEGNVNIILSFTVSPGKILCFCYEVWYMPRS